MEPPRVQACDKSCIHPIALFAHPKPRQQQVHETMTSSAEFVESIYHARIASCLALFPFFFLGTPLAWSPPVRRSKSPHPPSSVPVVVNVLNTFVLLSYSQQGRQKNEERRGWNGRSFRHQQTIPSLVWMGVVWKGRSGQRRSEPARCGSRPDQGRGNIRRRRLCCTPVYLLKGFVLVFGASYIKRVFSEQERGGGRIYARRDSWQ